MAEKTCNLKIDIERCKGCLLCIEVCPVKILKASEHVNKRGIQYVVLTDPEKCTGCTLCAMMCPDCAITIE